MGRADSPAALEWSGVGRVADGNKRKHVATGRKPPGGRRPGAGRPAGTRNALPLGTVQAVKAMRLRVPDGTPYEAAELADEALGTVVEVMRGNVWYQAAGPRLKAATVLREEICGPLAQKVEHSGTVTLEHLVLASMKKPEGA